MLLNFAKLLHSGSPILVNCLICKLPVPRFNRINQKLEPFFWLMTLNSLVNPLVYLGETFAIKHNFTVLCQICSQSFPLVWWSM